MLPYANGERNSAARWRLMERSEFIPHRGGYDMVLLRGCTGQSTRPSSLQSRPMGARLRPNDPAAASEWKGGAGSQTPRGGHGEGRLARPPRIRRSRFPALRKSSPRDLRKPFLSQRRVAMIAEASPHREGEGKPAAHATESSRTQSSDAAVFEETKVRRHPKRMAARAWGPRREPMSNGLTRDTRFRKPRLLPLGPACPPGRELLATARSTDRGSAG